MLLHYLYPPDADDGDSARHSLIFKVRSHHPLSVIP